MGKRQENEQLLSVQMCSVKAGQGPESATYSSFGSSPVGLQVIEKSSCDK